MEISLLLELRRCYLVPGEMILHFFHVSSVQLEIPEGISYIDRVTNIRDTIHLWEACSYGMRLLNHIVHFPPSQEIKGDNSLCYPYHWQASASNVLMSDVYFRQLLKILIQITTITHLGRHIHICLASRDLYTWALLTPLITVCQKDKCAWII